LLLHNENLFIGGNPLRCFAASVLNLRSIYVYSSVGMEPEWEIKTRAHRCAKSEEPFAEGGIIYTLLFRERNGFRREDITERVWLEVKDDVQPFSFWKSRYQAPPPPAPDPMPKESGEALLRRLLAEDRPDQVNARYVLSIMLERKKIFKQVDVRENGEEKLLIYEHARTGEVFIIGDPRLKLDELDSVQEKVYSLLALQSRVRQPEN
jgi:hypothetical protein